MTPQESKPLVNITESGQYVLKLIKPKDDEKKAKRFFLSFPDKDGKQFAVASLFFMDSNSRCLTKRYDMRYEGNRKGLAILVGRLTGKFCPSAPESITVESLFRYVEPALGVLASIDMEVSLSDKPDKRGNPQYRYKFTKIEGHVPVNRKPSAESEPKADPFDAPDSGAVPF